MRKLIIPLLSVLPFFSFSQSIVTKFESSKGTQTPTYFEIIDWWKKLDEKSGKIKMLTMGMTDAGFPLHLVVVANNGDYNFENIRKNDKRVILINNGIHPGEPDGIDGSILLARDVVTGKYKLPDNIILAIIPVYNIGGCLNRSANYRVDQNGPDEFGFRGNSQNLDLNRDFIKNDSKDARAFVEIFHKLDPDVFIDNHVSNGADYQYIMTLLTTQHNKLGGVMGEFLNKKFDPALYTAMKEKGFDMTPYVNIHADIPDKGWPQFWDSPRYSSGYGTLWHTFSFVPETHMLKSYDQRVKSTYALMQCFIEFTTKNSNEIKRLRNEAKESTKSATQFPVKWEVDKTKFTTLHFKGFESGYKTSDVSGLPRLYYDRSKPFEKDVPFYNYFIAQSFIQKPKAYIIPQGWWKVIELLQLNKIQMRQLKKDTIIEVEVYRIDEYKSSPKAYEHHHPNSIASISKKVQSMLFRKGDWYIPMNQEGNRFLVEVLEPECEDSYFTWNYFDAVLGQKEGYSAYEFENIAADYLKTHEDVKKKLDDRRITDTAFAKSAGAQLNFVYQNSPYFEPDYLRYPVYRILK